MRLLPHERRQIERLAKVQGTNMKDFTVYRIHRRQAVPVLMPLA